MTRSAAFERFLKSVESKGVLNEGGPLRGYRPPYSYAVGDLATWADGERAEAEALLLGRLRAEGDPLWVEALADLRTPSALAAVREVLESGRGEARAMAAYFLADFDVAMAMLDDPEPAARFWALATLDSVGGSAARPGLVRALADDDRSIRWIACHCLIPRMGLTEHFEQRLFAPRARLEQANREERPAIVEEILALLDTLRRRETAEGLGYVQPGCWSSPAVGDLMGSYYGTGSRGARVTSSPYAEDLDLAAIDSMDGEERAKAAAQLIQALVVSSAGDCRVPRALLRLGVPEAAEGLAAVLPGSEGEFAVEIARALWHLARRPEALEKLRALETHAEPAVRERARAALDEAAAAPG